MKQCKYTQKDIFRYLSGKMSEKEENEFQNHLFDCEDCMAKVEQYRQLKSKWEGTPQTERKPRFYMTTRFKWITGCAAAIAVIIVVSTIIIHSRQSSDNLIADRHQKEISGKAATLSLNDTLFSTADTLRAPTKKDLPQKNTRSDENNTQKQRNVVPEPLTNIDFGDLAYVETGNDFRGNSTAIRLVDKEILTISKKNAILQLFLSEAEPSTLIIRSQSGKSKYSGNTHIRNRTATISIEPFINQHCTHLYWHLKTADTEMNGELIIK